MSALGSGARGLLLAGVLLGGCGAPAENPAPAGEQAVVPGPEIPAALIAGSWPMLVADEAAVQVYAAQQGWIDLVMKRDLRSAVELLGPVGGLAGARAHLETSLMFKQAALVAAQSYVQTYGLTPQETDPAGAAQVLMVSYLLLGQVDKAQAARASLPTDGPSAAWSAPWLAWMDSGAVWPPDLSALPLSLPEDSPGVWPEIGSSASYVLPERGEVETEVSFGDPSAMLALALWHERVADQLAGDQAPLLDLYAARYQLPVEPQVAGDQDLPLELLFGSDFGTPADGAFMAAVTGAQGAAAVDTWRDRSLIAAIAFAARKDGALDSELALDLVGDLRDRLKGDLEAKAGAALPFHRTFARVLTVGLLRQLAVVAAAEGNEKTGGILRINAMERSEDEARCAVGLLSLAAWDAGNRYPMRGADIIHSHSRRYPSLEIARFALDALAIRVGRERGNVGGVGI